MDETLYAADLALSGRGGMGRNDLWRFLARLLLSLEIVLLALGGLLIAGALPQTAAALWLRRARRADLGLTRRCRAGVRPRPAVSSSIYPRSSGVEASHRPQTGQRDIRLAGQAIGHVGEIVEVQIDLVL